MEGMLIIVGMLCIAAMLVWVLRGKQGRRVVSWILCVALCCSYIPDISIAKADTVNLPVVSDAQISVNSIQKAQMGEVSYSEVPSEAINVETVSSVWQLNDTTAMLRAGKKDTVSFSGTISAPEGERISWVRVDVYDAASQEPYTVGEEYFYAMNLNQQQYDLSNIPPMKIADVFGTSDYVLEEGKQYIIMLQAGDSKGNLLQDLDNEVDGDQGPAVLLTVKLSPENCTHPHANYRYILHDSGKTRVYCYGDSLVHQIEPLYERYCGLCDRYLMNIWGQGTPEEHSMANGVCSVCGYIEGSNVEMALPEIQSIGSSAGEVYTAGTEVTFTAVASAEAGLSEIALYIDDELRLSENAAGTVDSLKYTINDLTIGEHTVKATVVDEDGWYNEASYTVMVLQADFASCAHVNTAVQQTTQYIEDANGEMQPITVDVVHCLDCATDLYTNEPLMTLDDNAADYVYTAKDGKATITEYVGTETNVVVPETINGYTVAVIDEWAFSYTSAVTVTLPNTIETINEWAFGGDNLAEIHVNKNAFVHGNAFSGCYGPTVVYGYTGSTAEKAAETAGLEFVSVGSLAAAPTLTVEPDTVAYGEKYTWSVSHSDTDTIWIQRSFEAEDGWEMYAHPLTEYEEGEYTWTADEFTENYFEVITAKALINGDWSAIAQVRVKVICEIAASEEYEYTVKNGTIEITGYLGTDTDVTIPSEIDGYTVTSIGDTAFLNTDVVSVTFPSTLDTLGMAVFYGCNNLESIYTNKKLFVEFASSFQDCEGVTVYGYSGGSVEAAAREGGCNFVSLGTLSSVVPTLTVTPATVAYGEECEIKCELEGADLFDIRVSFVSASESYEYSMIEEVDDGFLNMALEMSYPDEDPFSFTETYKASARVNGEWTQYCAPQTVTVIADSGVLSAPVIHEIQSTVPAHKELTISWDPVENAQEYEVRFHSIYGGYYELATSTPESTSRTLTIEEINNQYFPIGSDRESIDIDVEVTAKADGYSSAVGKTSFTMKLYSFGKPQLQGVPEKVVQNSSVTVTWPAVEYADQVDGLYYTFALVDEEGNEELFNAMWCEGTQDLTTSLYFGWALGSHTMRVTAETYDAAIKEAYTDYQIEVIAPFDYEIVNGKAIITGYNGSEEYLTIPETINGYPVVKIGDSAFEGNTTITEVYLPDSVEEIGAKAFKNCTGLESIYGPGVTSIGAEAFYGCVNLINVQFYKYIYYIGGNAFYGVDLPDYTQPLTVYLKGTDTVSFEGNDVIGKVVYPEGVTEIPARTHYANTKLGEVYLPTTLKTIGSQAFAACDELNYVKLYDGITSIADDAFADSPNTVLYIYVKDMETVSYVEQYAIDHQIPYHKFLYTTEGPITPTVSVSSQVGGGVIDVQGNEVWVKVNEEIILGAAGNSAEVAHFYLNDKLVGKYEFESAVVEIPHTFTEPGDVTFYAKTYSGTELIETSQTLTIHVVGVALSVDKEEPWTCESVHFELAASNLSGTASIYAEDTHLLDVEITDGKAAWEYAFRKAGQRTIRVVINGLDPMEKTITVKCIDKLSAPVMTAEDVQRLDDGMALSWNAIEHAGGYVVRVINTAGETFLTEEIVADSTQTVSHTIDADKLQGAGTYAVFVMAYGYQYDQSESEAVNIAMVEENGFFFTVDKTQVTTGEPVTFTVYASGASAVELVVDGQSIEVYDMTNDILTVERAFSKSGDRETAFRALIDGTWSDTCEPKIIRVTSQGQLDDPMPETKQYHRLGSDVEVTWPAVERADGYIIRVYDADGNQVYDNEIEAAAEADVFETIPSETFVSCTVYSIDVQAYGAGYDQSEGSTTTEMLEKLPGPIIVTPADNEALTERSCELTWETVDGAQSYVVSLAKKATNENGETVYEKVWASPNEVVNVGNVRSYLLENLEYGAEYRAAVGAVLEGTGLDDATEVGWSTRLFCVAMPELGVTITVNPETANEKQNVTITVSVENANVAAILRSGADEIAPTRNEEKETGREFDFAVTEQKQGTYTYTVIVEGTGEFAGVRNEKTVTVTYLDANAAVVHGITADPATCWADTNVTFEIAANEMTEQVKIQLYQGEKLLAEDTTESGAYDNLFVNGEEQADDTNKRVFTWPYHFTNSGVYTLYVTPINADNESGAVSKMTYTVLERGKLPNPVITSPKNGSIETDESVTVTWDAVALSPEMAFGGYCILLEKQNENGEYAAVPAYTYVNTSETSYTLTGLEPGGAYRLHLYTLEKDHIEPDGKLHGEAKNVDFTYRTVPEFKITSISGGDLGDPITVKWNAPAWPQKNLAPEFYMVSLIGPDGKQIGDAVRVQSSAAREYTFAGESVAAMGSYTVCVAARMASWDTQAYRAEYIATDKWNVDVETKLEFIGNTNNLWKRDEGTQTSFDISLNTSLDVTSVAVYAAKIGKNTSIEEIEYIRSIEFDERQGNTYVYHTTLQPKIDVSYQNIDCDIAYTYLFVPVKQVSSDLGDLTGAGILTVYVLPNPSVYTVLRGSLFDENGNEVYKGDVVVRIAKFTYDAQEYCTVTYSDKNTLSWRDGYFCRFDEVTSDKESWTIRASGDYIEIGANALKKVENAFFVQIRNGETIIQDSLILNANPFQAKGEYFENEMLHAGKMGKYVWNGTSGIERGQMYTVTIKDGGGTDAKVVYEATITIPEKPSDDRDSSGYESGEESNTNERELKKEYLDILKNLDSGDKPADNERILEILDERLASFGLTIDMRDGIAEAVSRAEEPYQSLYLYGIFNYEIKIEDTDEGSSAYNPRFKEIRLKVKDSNDLITWFHETGHAVDHSANSEWFKNYYSQKEGLYEALRRDVQNRINSTIDRAIQNVRMFTAMDNSEQIRMFGLKELIIQEIIGEKNQPGSRELEDIIVPATIAQDDSLTKVYIETLRILRNEMAQMPSDDACMVFDIYGGITNNTICAEEGNGHDAPYAANAKNYWFKKNGEPTYNQCSEAFAEFFASQFMGDDAQREANEAYFPIATQLLEWYAREMLEQIKNG